jgi:hypothetical protein
VMIIYVVLFRFKKGRTVDLLIRQDKYRGKYS